MVVLASAAAAVLLLLVVVVVAATTATTPTRAAAAVAPQQRPPQRRGAAAWLPPQFNSNNNNNNNIDQDSWRQGQRRQAAQSCAGQTCTNGTLGVPCGAAVGAWCVSGQYCAATTGTCEALAWSQPGDACSVNPGAGTPPACVGTNGLSCGAAGTCGHFGYQPSGACCGEDDAVCASGRCVDGTCAALARGAACTGATPQPLACDAPRDFCRAGVCAARLPRGAECLVQEDGCELGSLCAPWSGNAPNGTCVEPFSQPEGAACDHDDVCASASCLGSPGACGPTPPAPDSVVGQPCQMSNFTACPLGYSCTCAGTPPASGEGFCALTSGPVKYACIAEERAVYACEGATLSFAGNLPYQRPCCEQVQALNECAAAQSALAAAARGAPSGCVEYTPPTATCDAFPEDVCLPPPVPPPSAAPPRATAAALLLAVAAVATAHY